MAPPKMGNFFLGEILDYFDGPVSLFFGEPFGFHAVDQFLHNKRFSERMIFAEPPTLVRPLAAVRPL
jgi:hypothetical protein